MKAKLSLISAAAAMLALQSLPGIASVRNDEESLEALQNRLLQLNQASQNIINAADAAGRDMTPEEDVQLDGISTEFEQVEASIKRRERALQMSSRLGTAAPRRTSAELGDGEGGAAATNAGAPQAGAPSRTAQRMAPLPAEPRDVRAEVGKHGFLTFADFLMSVKRAGGQGATPDPRLARNAAPGTYGSEGSGTDGGFAVPPDFKTSIMQKVLGVDALLPLTDNQQTSSNGMTFPVDETTPWGSSGIQAYWTAEAGQKIPSKPALGAKAVKLNKLACLVPMSDELLEDAAGMATYVNNRAPDVITWKVNEAIIRGSGVGTPLGILQSPGTVVVAAEAGQAAGTVVMQNILKVWASLRPEARREARWFMHPDVEASVMALAFPGTGTAVPIYLPPGGLRDTPYATLLGRPVMPQDACSALGLQGDIIFGDLKNYLAVTKAGGVKQDVSIHIWFDYDITAFRFVFRVGGEPWWNAGVLPAQAGATTRGYFSTLAARP